MSSKLHIFNPPDVHPPKPTYSHVAEISLPGPVKLITIAGQIGNHPTTGKVPPTFPEQVQLALENVERCLAAAGAGKKDIMKITHYVVDYDPTDRRRGELYLKWLGEDIENPPPATLVPVPKLADPDLLFEIEVMAVVAG